MTLNEWREEYQRVRGLALEHGNMKYLLDCRDVVGVERIRTIALRETKHIWFLSWLCEAIGVVLQEADKEHLQIVNLIAQSMGAKIKLFSDIDGAYEWLGVH